MEGREAKLPHLEGFDLRIHLIPQEMGRSVKGHPGFEVGEVLAPREVPALDALEEVGIGHLELSRHNPQVNPTKP